MYIYVYIKKKKKTGPQSFYTRRVKQLYNNIKYINVVLLLNIIIVTCKCVYQADCQQK